MVRRRERLAQAALKIASPGVPDLYQGTETWALSLVDTDNRRPVDFARSASALAGLDVAPGGVAPSSKGGGTAGRRCW